MRRAARRAALIGTLLLAGQGAARAQVPCTMRLTTACCSGTSQTGDACTMACGAEQTPKPVAVSHRVAPADRSGGGRGEPLVPHAGTTVARPAERVRPIARLAVSLHAPPSKRYLLHCILRV